MTPEDALNRAMEQGAVSPDLPWVHKEGLQLLKANYATEAEAAIADSSATGGFLPRAVS